MAALVGDPLVGALVVVVVGVVGLGLGVVGLVTVGEFQLEVIGSFLKNFKGCKLMGA